MLTGGNTITTTMIYRPPSNCLYTFIYEDIKKFKTIECIYYNGLETSDVLSTIRKASLF